MLAVSDGGIEIKMFRHFEKLPYYTQLDKRITEQYGSDSWKSLYGTNMVEKRKAFAKQVEEKKAEFEDLQAGFDSMCTPTKVHSARQEKAKGGPLITSLTPCTAMNVNVYL